MGFSKWAQRLDQRVLGPVKPWREARPRDLVVLAAVPAASLVIGLVLWVLGVKVFGLIGYGIGGLLAAWPVYLLHSRADRKRLANVADASANR